MLALADGERIIAISIADDRRGRVFIGQVAVGSKGGKR